MTRASARPGGRETGGVALLEQAILLLRATPAESWAFYLLGAIPFTAGLFWFATDCLRDFYATSHLLGRSLAVTALFFWKQLCESVFVYRLHASLQQAAAPAGLARLASALVRQAAVQPSAFLGLPFAAISAVPLPFTLFFYRNVSLFALEDPRRALGRSWEQARLFQGQAWVFVSILSGIGLLLYANLLAGVLILAQLAKSVLGFEDLLSEPLTLLRSASVHSGILLLVYLCLDAILDAAAALRCFYGDSIQSGADILAGLRRVAAGAVLIAVLGAGALPAAAQVDQKALNESIDRTLERPEFAWRMPGAKVESPAPVSWFVSVLNRIGEFVDEITSAIVEWMRSRQSREPGGEPGGAAPQSLRIWLLILAGAAVVAGLIVYLRSRSRSRPAADAGAVAASSPIDVKDESVLADQLTEDLWLRAADDLIARGEYRLALRAMHLAGLRLLADRRLVTITRWKSGFEYLGELRRRARGVPRLGDEFARNLRLFDFGWYSLHPVEPPMLDEFRQRLQEIRVHAGG